MNKKKVSILKEKFESYGQNIKENIVMKCRSEILRNAHEDSDRKGLKRLKNDVPLPKMGTPPLVGVGKGGHQEERGR